LSDKFAAAVGLFVVGSAGLAGLIAGGLIAVKPSHAVASTSTAPTPGSFGTGATAALPKVNVTLKGCGATYKRSLAVNQALHIVNGGTVMRHQVESGTGPIVANLQPKAAKQVPMAYISMDWSVSGKGVWTLKFTHKGCATAEKVVATVK
jgi:hypothetical protein